MGSVLYIHPWGHLNDLVVPAGALTCMNAVSASKLGRYSFEVTDAEIEEAAIVAIDLHWSLGLSGLEPLLADVRRVNARVPIIVGGVSAGHWAAELLTRYPVDYVVCGDAEPSFAELVARLLAGGEPQPLANVYGRKLPPPRLTRMTGAEFDATDPLTADWFPTYEQCSSWAAAAFPLGRTIPVARGCPLRCPDCYGSYAATFGPGYLLRSTRATVGLLRRSEHAGQRNLRLFLGKPPALRVAKVLQGIARAGPFTLPDEVGLYLCAPVAAPDLAALAGAFPNGLSLSLVHPEAHEPPLSPSRVSAEGRSWQEAAATVAGSRTLSLDVWTPRAERLPELRRAFGAVAGGRVKVSPSTAWDVPRPTDAADAPSFDAVREAVLPLWTFYAARILSPALAQLLMPFRLLDHLDDDPPELAPPSEELAAYVGIIQEGWRRHRLPLLPGLRFAVHPGADEPGATETSTPQRVRLTGALGFRVAAAPSSEGVPLEERRDRAGVELRGHAMLGPETRTLAFVPSLAALGRAPEAVSAALAAPGLITLAVPPGSVGVHIVSVTIRVQEVGAALLGADGEPICRGRAHLGYFGRR